jgi:hypothetical protein
MTTLLVVVGALLAGLLLFLTSQSESRQEIGAIAQYGECDPPGPPNEPGLPPCPGPPDCPPGNPPNDPDCPPGPPGNCPPQSQNPNCPDQGVNPEQGGGQNFPGGDAGGVGTASTATSGETATAGVLDDSACVALQTSDSSSFPEPEVAPAPMLGENVVPGPGDPDGAGIGVFCVAPNTANEWSQCYEIKLTGSAPPTQAVIGRAPAGEEGETLTELFDDSDITDEDEDTVYGCSTRTANNFEAEFTGAKPTVDEDADEADKALPYKGLEPELLAKIITNPQNFFLQVDTEEFPDGALRGQFEKFEGFEVPDDERFAPLGS